MTNTPLPGHSDQPAEITCSSCGRFVGALSRCPYCGAKAGTRLSVRLFRYAALLLATVGLGLLYLMARHQEIPVVKIGEVKPTMNFAYVRVAGTVSGDARTFKEGGKIRSLRFMVDDGTGEISVTAYRAQAEALAARDGLPRLGDRVEVCGSLSVSADDNVVMRLQVPEQLVITRAEMPVTALGDVDEGLTGNSILVEGEIVRVEAPKPNSKQPWGLVVKDDSGSKEITFWEDAYAEIRDKILLMPGTPIRARVSVKTYRDKLQLSLGSGTDLEFPAAVTRSPAAMTAGPGAPTASAAAETPLADVSGELAGRTVRVTGRVEAIQTPEEGSKAPYEITLKDGDSAVAVVYWDTVARNLGANKPSSGVLMRVEGQVNVYKGKTQIKVGHSNGIALLDVEPASKPVVPAGKTLAIAKITSAMAKSFCTAQGTLGEPKSVRGGVIYPLTDDSGTIQLVLWDKSVPGPDRDRLVKGVKVKVTGQVVDYKGTLEIVPASAQAIIIE